MSLELQGYVDLPAHQGAGGFDHAAVHRAGNRLYVAHTANDAVDVIDCASDRYLYSVEGLAGVAGALVSEERDLVFTSNRGEDSVGIFAADDPGEVAKVGVGVRPNGLSFDAGRGLLLAANVGNPDIPGSFTLSIVDVPRQQMVASIPVPGRTRWTVFEPVSGCFYINIADPSEIVVVVAADPARVSRSLVVPARGPHGLDFDPATGGLFCACDAGKLFALDAASGEILHEADLSGVPDVIFFNAARGHLYAAVGDPGVIDMFETGGLKRIDTISTEKGSHTLGFDAARDKVYAFLPETHRAAVYLDQ